MKFMQCSARMCMCRTVLGVDACVLGPWSCQEEDVLHAGSG